MSQADVKRRALLAVGLMLGAVGCGEEGHPRVTYRAPLVVEGFAQSPDAVGPGEPLTLGLTVSGPRGEPLAYAWTTNAGTVGPTAEGGGEAVWLSPSCLPPGVTPTVTVTVTHAAGLSVSHTFPVTWTGPACTLAPCTFSLGAQRFALEADCTTDSTLFIPHDYTFDGQGHTLTVVDPPGGSFSGAALRNRGTTSRVRNVTVTTSGLADVCREGAARLRGILFQGASGEVADTVVRDVNKAQDTSGCQEGIGIEVRNDDASGGPFRVDVLRNRVAGYQKAGILAIGAVDVTLEGNTVEGRGAVAHIARNGIQVSNGARGRVTGNTVSGNAYTGPAVNTTGAGILVTGGSYYGAGRPTVTALAIEGNTLTDNDIGVSLSQYEGPEGNPPARTGVRVAGNRIHHAGAVLNPYYQAGIADSGTGNVITSNTVTGSGYNPALEPGRLYSVDVLAVGPASRLTFLTPAYELATGACSGRVTVQSQDAAGNLVPTAATLTLTASGPAAEGVTFHADPGCTGSAPAVSLYNPQAELTFYFKSSQPGAVTVSVSDGSLSGAQEQLVR